MLLVLLWFPGGVQSILLLIIITTFATSAYAAAPEFTAPLGEVELEAGTIGSYIINATDSYYEVKYQNGTKAPDFIGTKPSRHGLFELFAVPDRTQFGLYQLRITIWDKTNVNDRANDDFILNVTESSIEVPRIIEITDTTLTVELAPEDRVSTTGVFLDGPETVYYTTGSTITVTDLKPETRYDGYVFGLNYAILLSLDIVTTSPFIPSTEIGHDTIFMSWNADSSYYEVSTSDEIVASGMASEGMTRISGLEPGTTYMVNVYADNTKAMSVGSFNFETRDTNHSIMIEDLDTTAISHHAASFSWMANHPGFFGYRVTTDSNDVITQGHTGYYQANTTINLDVDSLQPGTNYNLKVSALYNGTSGYMEVGSATKSFSTTNLPLADLAVHKTFSTHVDLTWTAISRQSEYIVKVTDSSGHVTSHTTHHAPADSIVKYRLYGLEPCQSYTVMVSVPSHPVTGPATDSDPITFSTWNTKPIRSIDKVSRVGYCYLDESSITIHWDRYENGNSYVVFLTGNDGDTTRHVANGISHTIHDLIPGTTYRVEVQLNGNENTKSHKIHFTPSFPPHMWGLVVTSKTDGATASWQKYGDTNDYVIRVNDSNGARVLVNHVAGTTHTITGLDSDTSYQVLVRLKGDTTMFSNTKTFTTLSANGGLTGVEDSIVLNVNPTTNGANLSWNQYHSMTDYVVRINNNDGSRHSAHHVSGTTYTITGLDSDTSYQVLVRLKGDTSTLSDIKTFTTLQ